MTDNAQIERIIKECLWDRNYSPEDVSAILEGDEKALRRFLFQKILFNSSRMLFDLSLFSLGDISELLAQVRIGTFQKEYYERRKKMAEIYFLDAPNTIMELRWPA